MRDSGNDWTRRSFLKAQSLVLAAGSLAPVRVLSGAVSPAPTQPGKEPWYKHAYRRAVIDMHISDWDEKFLSEVDPAQFVATLKKSKAQSIVLYCHSHVGLFNHPTQVGRHHHGLKGRNLTQELIDACHGAGIAVVLYTSLIHDDWAFDQHPEWAMKTAEGTPWGKRGRYRLVCPNSGYREYVRSWTREICEKFDFEGIRFDMTFWVGVCYCDACQKRFSEEVGGEIPRTVDWLDPKWVALQRKREEWLAEFAAIATGTVRELKPEASVEHQSSTYPLNWTFGVATPLIAQNDFLQGDFYGDALQGSFVRKLLEELTPNKPFGYETSFSFSLRDHTGKKSKELLAAKAASSITDHAAFIFIDAIDPIGTVNPGAHERMGEVFEEFRDFYPELGGERVRDVGIYYSLESKFDFKGNGSPAGNPNRDDSHTDSAMQAARWLISNHIPFGVVSKKSLVDLRGLKALLLPNVNMMDEEEAAAIREWVRQGGSLYASGCTSLVNKKGERQEDFLLADLFGVSLLEPVWEEKEHYLCPTEAGADFLSEWSEKYPAYVRGDWMKTRPHEGASVLATTTLPWTSSDAEKFASIHSSPPWEKTEYPEIVLNTFGKGKAIYCASCLERFENLAPSFLRLIQYLAGPFQLTLKAPACVEATLFHQPDRGRYLLALVNFQKDLPNLPVEGISAQLSIPGVRFQKARLLPGGRDLESSVAPGGFTFQMPVLETLGLVALDYASPAG
jgi:hypothetical protein